VTVFLQNDATGAGAGNLDPNTGFVNLSVIANLDTGLGMAAAVGDRQQITYAQTVMGTCPNRLNMLVNTVFQVDYGMGMGMQTVNIVILPCLANFTLNDNSLVSSRGGVTLPPAGSGLAGAALNTGQDCLIVYDTTQNNGMPVCVTRANSGGTIDLPLPNPVIVYHEMSHALRIVTNAQLALTAACNPSSPEEAAAMTDENDMRTQLAALLGQPAELRDTAIYCGALCTGPTPNCCIVASVASGSPVSEEVQALRGLRDGFLRVSEVGYAFFDRLHYDYYSFSPQVCTLMARRPELSQLVLSGFVRPLISALRLMKAYAIDGLEAAALGRTFASMHADPEQFAATLSALRGTRAFWTGVSTDDDEIAAQLSALLRERALPSSHINWALIETVRIYGEALEEYALGATAEALGARLAKEFTDWTVALPLDHIWASLSTEQLEIELAFYENLLRPAEGKARFRDRLRARFGNITAMRMVLDRASPWAEERLDG